MVEALRIAIPTRNRPYLLRRAVTSVLKDVSKSDRPVELLIADQSDLSVEGRNAKWLAGAAKSLRGEIFHLDSRARKFLEGLGPLEIAQLSGDPLRLDRYGENRNWISLFFAGCPYVSFDDDVIVNGGIARELRGAKGCQVDSQIPWSFLAYTSRADLSSEMDPISSRRCVALEMLDGLSLGLNGSEVFAVPGVAGHSGLASHVLLADISCDLSSRRMLASTRTFSSLVASTSVVRQATHLRVDALKSLVATAYATKNQAHTVPFLPSGRGEDHVFAKALRASGKSSLMVSLDFSVFHLPQHERCPARVVDVTGIASIVTAAIESIGNCDSSDHLFAELLGVVRHKEHTAIVQAALCEHAERQMHYCAAVAQAVSQCSGAFAAIETLILSWQALAQKCRSSELGDDLVSRLHEAIKSICQFAQLGEAWQQLWKWFVANQDVTRDGSRIHDS